MTKANSQTRKALAALRQGKHLTQRIAIELWAAYRLSSIITRLRAEGWNIKTKLVPNGNGSRHAEYRLGRPHKTKTAKANSLNLVDNFKVGMRVESLRTCATHYKKGAKGTIKTKGCFGLLGIV